MSSSTISSSSSSSAATPDNNDNGGNSINNGGSNNIYTPPTIEDTKVFRSSSSSKLVIAGAMTVSDGFCNIAELSLDSGQWSLKERIQLSLYDSYSGGEVYSLLVNHTFDQNEFSDVNSLEDKFKSNDASSSR